MLDTPLTSVEAGWTTPAETGQTVTLADGLIFLRRQFWLIAGAVLAAVVLALLYVMFTPAEYLGRAELLIEPGKQHALWQSNGVVDLTIDNAQVESQVEVLRSERIANAVIAKLDLIDDSEFRKSGTDYERQRAALGQFESALSVRRIGQSYVIEVTFRSLDPEKAARIANAVTEAYLQDQQQAKRDVAQQAAQWTEDQITALGIQLNNAAAAVQQFRVSHGIAAVGGSSDQPQLIDKLTELEAQAQAYRKVYETLLERFTENQQQASYPVSNARVITAASRPLVKSYPRAKLVLLLAVLLGLVIGVACAAARVMLDGSVRSAKQLRQALGIAVLGSLPSRRTQRGLPDQDVAVVDVPLSPFADAVRSLKISVQHACGERSGCCLGLLSLLPDDESDIIAVNLAALFQAAGSKTLLVDANLRDRRLTERLAPDAPIGLAEALREGTADALLFEPKTATYLLPVGSESSAADIANILNSPAFEALLPSLKEQFSTVIVDLPALQRTGDARAVAPLLDGCIIVVSHGRTSLRNLEDAVELLRADNVSLFGVVLAEVSEDIPPVFGVHLDEVRDFNYVEYVQRLGRSMRQRWARG